MMTPQQFQVLLKISQLSIVFTLIRSFACAQLAITKFPMATHAELVIENAKAQIQKATFSYIWVIKLIFFQTEVTDETRLLFHSYHYYYCYY